MASNNCQYNLNTENCTILHELAKQIHTSVQKNDQILARLTTLIDTKLRLPKVPERDDNLPTRNLKTEANEDEKVDTPNSPQIPEISSTNGSSDSLNSGQSEKAESNGDPETSDTDDYLRSHLDQNLQIGSVTCDERQFGSVKNSRVRQLLVDNYRLLKVKEAKQAENSDLWSIYTTYERLLTEVIIPKLTQDVNAGNVQRIAAAREICLAQKFPLEDEVWRAYCEYVEHLENVRVVTAKLVMLLEGHIHSEQMERLATQVSIVENLTRHLNAGGLHRKDGNRHTDGARDEGVMGIKSVHG